MEDNFSVLYYSKSDDEGITWSDPENISQNESRYYVYPQICSDSENNLYIAFDNYDYSSTTEVVFSSVIIFSDGDWSEANNLAEGFKSRIVADNDNRVYVFWYQGTPHNGDNFITMNETYDWIINFDSQMRKQPNKTHWDDPQLSDLGNLASQIFNPIR